MRYIEVAQAKSAKKEKNAGIKDTTRLKALMASLKNDKSAPGNR